MGRTEEARRELEALAAGGFAGVASDMNWLASMAELSQGAALLGTAAHAERIGFGRAAARAHRLI